MKEAGKRGKNIVCHNSLICVI